MNRQIVKTLVAAAMLMMVLVAASAVQAIDPPHNLVCNVCHVANRVYGVTAPYNVCLQCHQSGQSAGVNPYTLQDMANPFGTFTSTLPGTKTQSSHNWSAPSNFPAAGSQEAQDPSMTLKASLNGTVSCSRCHEIHGSYTSARYKPLLRMPNDNDQMCLDCHRQRNTTTSSALDAAQQGTHPVSFGYNDPSSKVTLKPTEYYATPQNSNPANPTAALKLINGKVLCSTCHKVHFADSNSNTFHNHSSAMQGKLSSSTGILLRTGMFGKTSASVNICTNCHNKPNHNGKSQNIQCADCHAGHVDYDPLDPNGTLTKNVYLVRRYVNYSGGVKLPAYRRRVFFQYTGSQRNYSNGQGVCQGCHNVPPPGGTYPPEHASTDPKVCNNCHGHSSVAGSFSGGCSSCHGYPPAHTNQGGPGGYAYDGNQTPVRNYFTSGVYKNESTASHAPHAGSAPYAFACTECHKGNGHDGNNFQDVFIDKTSIIASIGGANPTYATAGNGTCNTTYCHSNGAPRGGTLKYKTPQWGLGRKTIVGTANECTSCHNGVTATFNNMSSNAHFKHVSNVATTGKNYGCVVCHAATVSNNTTVSIYASHVNGSKDVSYAGLAAGSTWDGVGATCASYCHSNGKGAGAVTTPNWTSKATGACGTCHAASTVIGGATLISTNGHFVHFSSASNSYGPMLTQRSATSTNGCAACHTYTGDLAATHVNGTVDVPTANCTTSCHKQVASINPAWTSGPVTCESCHTTTGGALSVINGITAPDKTGFPTQGHGQYLINAANVKCLDCHLRNDRHINSNAAVHYTRLGASYNGISENNLCVVCHNDPTKVITAARQNMSTHVLDKNATPTPDMCSACHDVHGSSNVLSINSKITFNALSAPVTIVFTDKNNVASYVNPTTYRGLCQVCHTQTKYYTRDNKGNPLSHNPGSLCLSCHDHKAAYAFKPNGTCDACHGYPPVLSVAGIGKQNNYSSARLQNYSGGGGAHAVLAHIPATAKASDAWTYCVACHNQGSAVHTMDTSVWVPANSTAQRKANVTVTVDPQYRFNNAKPLNASQYRKPTPGASGSCWNASCHMQPTPQWGNDK